MITEEIAVRPPLCFNFRPNANTVLWLPGQDDPQSATIRDRSNNGNNGAITGATWTRQPSGLWALSFDGTGDYVNCGNNASLQITNNLSIILWFKTPVTFTTGGASAFATFENLISKYTTAGDQRGWHIAMANVLANESVDNISIVFGDPVDGTLEYIGYYATDLAVSTWYRITMTFASGTLLLQVNGASAALTTNTGAVPATLWNSTASVFLGAVNAGAASLSKGQQILQRIMNTVITPAQDTAGFNQERHLFGI